MKPSFVSLLPTLGVTLGLLGLLGPGCGGGNQPVPLDASPACLEAVNHSDLTWIQANVFTPKCTFSACHNGDIRNSREDLRDGMTVATTVNVASHVFPQYMLVVPGDPANSYMMSILRGGPMMIDPNVGTMPKDNPALCSQRIDAVERWIMAGALTN
jgi:hypothetical protein